jgi:putative PIN family toxin of toxin-antitoxin system
MLDTNIFISIAVFKSSALGKLLNDICTRHTLVLSSYILDELSTVIRSKFPDKAGAMDDILFNMPFETEYTPQALPSHSFFTIRDPKDEKVLYSAITADVDVLITGDKDFDEIILGRPEILSPTEFMKKYE